MAAPSARSPVRIAPAVAKAAMDSGVAERPIEDMEAYEQHLQQFVYHSGTTMKPIFQLARGVEPEKKRIVFAEGEEERVLRAMQIIVDEKLAKPILIGRPAVIEQRIARYGLRLVAGQDYTVVNTDHDERYRDFWQQYHKMMSRKGITEQMAKLEMRRRTTLIGAMMVERGEADGMICGTVSTTHRHLHFIDQVIGKKEGAKVYAAMNALVLPNRQIFLVDTHVNVDPTPEQLAEITIMAAEEVRRFGIEPKVALLSHSNFGTSERASARKMREARELFEREYLLTQINRFGGNISRTAQFVGMERSALHRKLKVLGLSDPREPDELHETIEVIDETSK